MRMIEPVANEVNATYSNREHLVVLFNSEVQISFQVIGNFRKKGMEVGFVVMQDHQVIGITEIMADLFYLFDPVVKVSQVKVCKVL